MIDQFWIENFKSYSEIAYARLTSLTFLIGANASGKSNLLESVRILNRLAMGKRLDDLLRDKEDSKAALRGLASDLFFNRGTPFKLGCSLDGTDTDKPYLVVEIALVANQLAIANEYAWTPDDSTKLQLYWVDSKTNPYTDEVRVAYNNFSPGPNKPVIACSDQQAIFYQLESPARFSEIHAKSQQLIPAVARRLREALRNIFFLDPRPSLMRGYSWKNDGVLQEDGSNLSSVLFNICSRGEAARQELLQFIRSLPEQDILSINFIETPRQEVMVQLIESFGTGNRSIDAPLLSDGTLRVLAVAALMLSAPEGALVIIEEIDNGVHPSRARALIENILTIAKKRNLRVLLTTHNPALLDALPNTLLEDVLCCYRDSVKADSRIVRLGDLERYPEMVAQATLGELATTKVLDRFLKEKTSEEERIQQSLKWLDDFNTEAAE